MEGGEGSATYRESEDETFAARHGVRCRIFSGGGGKTVFLKAAFFWGALFLPFCEVFVERDRRRAFVAGAKLKLTAKTFLAAERRIPGLGNGVLQGILFRACIHPKRRFAALDEGDAKRLFGISLSFVRKLLFGVGLLALWLAGLLFRWKWACEWQFHGKLWFFDDCKPETRRRVQIVLVSVLIILILVGFFVWR